VYKRVHEAIRMRGARQKLERALGYSAPQRIEIVGTSRSFRNSDGAQAADNENPFSRAPRDGLKTTTGRPS
jgi:hypothetical protein